MPDLLDQCHWPDLPERYATALRQAVAFILGHADVLGIIASGTILRGCPDPSSDLDFYVIARGRTRQRVQRIFAGVPAEVFINPPARIERYLVEEAAEGRPIAAHMLATGFVILATDPVVDELRARAAVILAATRPASPQQLTVARYMAATLFEDAVDVAGRDPATAGMILAQAVVAMLHYLFQKEHKHQPRGKDLLQATASLDPQVGDLARSFFLAGDPAVRLDLAGQIADRTIGVRGFFEWEAEPEVVA